MPPGPSHASNDPVLSPRALSRATLARQFLLERVRRPAIEVVEHLVGMQAQEPRDPYLGLWSRITGFDPADLENLLHERRVARSPLMRGTIHLATASDCLYLRALVQPVLTRTQRSAFGKRLPDVDLDALAAEGAALLAGEPRTFAQLRVDLGERWASYDQQALTQSISYLVPLVQTPPRGLWDETGRAAWVTAEAWLGRPLPASPSPPEMVLRYLAAFGPASVADIQNWSGLTRLREVVELLRPQLVTFRDDTGRELFDLPDAPRPDPETPAPVRFLPQYDNVFLGHADRRRIVSDEHRSRSAVANGYVSTLLVDGFIAAVWKLSRNRSKATLAVTPFESWPAAVQDSVIAEAGPMLAFIAQDAQEREIAITRPLDSA